MVRRLLYLLLHEIIVHVTKLILDLIPLFAGMITAAETPLPVSQISVLQQKSSYLIYPLEDKFQSPISLVSSVNRVLINVDRAISKNHQCLQFI